MYKLFTATDTQDQVHNLTPSQNQVDLTLSDSDDEDPTKKNPVTSSSSSAIGGGGQTAKLDAVASAEAVATSQAKSNGRFNLRNKTREKAINYNE